MLNQSALITLINVEILLTVGAACIFVISYTSFFNWRKTQAGVALFWVFVSFILLGTLALLSRVFGISGDLYAAALVFAWAFSGGTTVWLIIVLWSSWVLGKPAISFERKPDTRPVPVPRDLENE